MNDPGRLLSEHRGVVSAPAERVRDAVLTVTSGRPDAEELPLILAAQRAGDAVIRGGPQTFGVDLAGVALTIDVNRDEGWVQARGQWWWCTRLLVAEHPEGSLVTQRTYNLARGLTGRLVPFTVGRRHRDSGRQAMSGVLDELARRLGCATRELPD